MDVCIIGGGFTGLAAATTLVEQGHRVCILERAAQLGGLATGFKEPGWNSYLERYYHHWFTSDRYVIEFARCWGATDGLIFRRPITVFETHESGFVPLDSAWALLACPDLGIWQKLRMGAALAYLRYSRQWRSLEKVTAEAWCRRYMGEAGYSAIWAPMLQGKFGPYWSGRVNMAWLWARLHARSARLGTYRGGFQALVEKAETWLAGRGVEIRKDVGPLAVTSRADNRWQVAVAGGLRVFDAVLVAASPHALVGLVPELGSAFAEQLGSRPSLGVQVLILSLKRPLGRPGVYWYNLRKLGRRSFLAVVEHTQFVPSSEFGGETIVYMSDYVEPNAPEWQRSDADLLSLGIATLGRIQPGFDADNINRHWLFREPYAQPIPEVNASRYLPALAVPGQAGLFHASMAHVYPWDRGTNFALQLGADAAQAVSAYGHTLQQG